ncbi:hypothetical protein KFL_000310180 [Klebsormidium nitens]|uniref:cysteine dioxygenase n=1 Tax=Klebsormidium nitens TaxID=105231 RepID=A0A1Y1HSD4_KLENI|nr:hypothetical protein KFL_000310180 [Klebsormidium nitens]|eukprot:GAQ79467.1 hypothetical protein KFL_000310180 [Klebsormidium nitens]
MASKVQKLYDACRAAFGAKGPASKENLQLLQEALDSVTCADVGLDPVTDGETRGFGFFGRQGPWGRHSAAPPRWAPPISYQHIYEDQHISIGIFCLPTCASIPLHNHPGMVVMSKLLYGDMHVRSYDWANQEAPPVGPQHPPRRNAVLVCDEVLSAPCDALVLYPTSGGNIHAFTGVTPCAVLDVVAPPYDPESGRHCTYYRETPVPAMVGKRDHKSSAVTDESIWLEEFSPPDDFVIERGLYRGPKVQGVR